MGNRLTASELVVDLLIDLGLDPDRFLGQLIALAGTSFDFPVIFSSHLPFYVDQIGMRGITLAGKVWILGKRTEYSPEQLLPLITHEAVHVAQQRGSRLLFYPRYVGSWLSNLLPFNRNATVQGLRKRHRWSSAAYRGIQYEVDAYRVGALARQLIQTASSSN